MRRRLYLMMTLLIPALAACSDSTGPDSFSISGTWNSAGFATGDFSMTVVETARAVEGAGHRVVGGVATAYRVYGANEGSSASLLLDFDGEPDINFEGEFVSTEDGRALEGLLFGSGFVGEPITFQRQED